MKRNNTLLHNDNTRQLILPHLYMTGKVIDNLLKSLSLFRNQTIIEPMEDLGFANNIIRMRGGFYTGCYIEWDSPVPFIPVDSTVNACGVSVFRLSQKYTPGEFKQRCEYAIKEYDVNSFNFTRGNHFISLCKDDSNVQYLVIHASDNSFKFGQQGLYPYGDSWFIPNIKTHKYGDRFLRYLIGNPAEKFYSIYKEAEMQNPIRNCILCKKIIGQSGWEELIYSPHYGMPSTNSVAIGCQWQGNNKIILSTPGNDIYIIKGKNEEKYPHGFGMIKEDLSDIMYHSGELYINNRIVSNSDSYIINGNLQTRFSRARINESFIHSYLFNKHFQIISVLHQISSFNRDGFQTY